MYIYIYVLSVRVFHGNRTHNLCAANVGVGGPGEVLFDVHLLKFSAADSLHSQAVDGRDSPEVHHNLLLSYSHWRTGCLHHTIQPAVPLSVVRFIVVADETYHWCVIGKLDDVVGAELGSAVVGQQREEQRSEHTALWGTCAQCGSVAADKDWLSSFSYKVQDPVIEGIVKLHIQLLIIIIFIYNYIYI